MPISAKCPKCNATFSLESRMTGKKLRCQKCKAVFAAPTTASKPATSVPSMELDEKTDDVELVEAEAALPTPTQGEIIEAKVVKLPKKLESTPSQKQKSTPPPLRVPKPAASDTSSLLITIGLMLALCLGSSFVIGIGGFWLMLRQPVHVAGGPLPVDPKVEFNNRDFKLKEKIPANPKRTDPPNPDPWPGKTDPQKFKFTDITTPAPKTDFRPDRTEHKKTEDVPFKTEPPKVDERPGKTDPPIKEPGAVRSPLLTFDANGKINVKESYRILRAGEKIELLLLVDSHFQAYRVPLEAGKRYNLLCTGSASSPSVRIFCGGNFVALSDRCAQNGAYISFVPDQSDEHQLVVIRNTEGTDKEFSLDLMSEKLRPAERVIAKSNSQIIVRDEIKLHDADYRMRARHSKPSREFIVAMKKDATYKIQILDEKFQLGCRIYFNDLLKTDEINLRNPISWSFRSPQDGECRISVSGSDYPTGTFTLAVARADGEPTAEEADLSLANPARDVEGARVVRLRINRKYPKFVDHSVFAIAWAPDGQSFCFVDGDGQLCRVRADDLVLDKKIPVAIAEGETPNIVVNRGGIILYRKDNPDCLIIDAKTLEIKKKLLERPIAILSNPAQSTVLLRVGRPADAHDLLRYDLAKPESPPVTLKTALPVNSIWYASDLDVSGNHFLATVQQGGKIARFSVVGDNLRHEILPHSIHDKSGFVFVDPTPNKELVFQEHKKRDDSKSPFSALIKTEHGCIGFDPKEPSIPIFALNTESPMEYLRKDPRYPIYYGYNSSYGLIVADRKGNILRKINLLEGAPDFSDPYPAISVHPDGGKILIGLRDRKQLHVYQVELPVDILTAKAIIPLPKNEPRKTEVEFDAENRFMAKDQLAKDDPRRAGSMKTSPAYKTYTIRVEAGYTYDFIQRSKEIDSFLQLFDGQENLVVQNDDDGGELDSRILIGMAKAGTYKIRATSLNEEFGTFSLEIKKFVTPQPNAMATPLKSERRTVGDCVVTGFELSQLQVPPYGVTWSNDGKSLISFGAGGSLRRTAVPRFFEERIVHLGRSSDVRLMPFATKVALQNLETGVVYTVDSESLTVWTYLLSPTNSMAFTSRQSTLMVFAGNGLADRNTPYPFLCELDIATAQRTVSGLPKGLSLVGISHSAKMVYARNDANLLFRIAKLPDKLRVEQIGEFLPAIWRSEPVVVSADGEWVMRPYDAKTFPHDKVSLAPASGVGIIVYRANDIRKAAFVLDTETPAGPPATDPKTGNIYVHSPTKGFMIFDRKGTLLRILDLAKSDPPENIPTRILVHPDGGKLVFLTGRARLEQALYIELPEKLTASPP